MISSSSNKIPFFRMQLVSMFVKMWSIIDVNFFVVCWSCI